MLKEASYITVVIALDLGFALDSCNKDTLLLLWQLLYITTTLSLLYCNSELYMQGSILCEFCKILWVHKF